MILIFVSFESMEDADKAANHLIDNKLAACVEVFPVTNYYVWEGKKTKAAEFSGIIKTDDGYFKKVSEALGKILPYSIPQIIEIKAENVNESYLAWLKNSLEK
ncbi:MAG TPA: divalent-cation tolerance protein CutA [Patescibacteria group bacterium]|nr:divalent-cation tolerance protein CutA [Patescibacteria group bacterium]